jgi:hypothetical protein
LFATKRGRSKKRHKKSGARNAAGASGPGWCSPGSWPDRDRPRRITLYQLSKRTADIGIN